MSFANTNIYTYTLKYKVLKNKSSGIVISNQSILRFKYES